MSNMADSQKKLNVLMCEFVYNRHRLDAQLNSHQAARYVLCPSTATTVLRHQQGEYTTGWTGAGASKSDKKVSTCNAYILELCTDPMGRLDRCKAFKVSAPTSVAQS